MTEKEIAIGLYREGMKTCNGCAKAKPIADFGIKKTVNGVPIYRGKCKECIRGVVHARLERQECTGSLHEQVALNRLWRTAQ